MTTASRDWKIWRKLLYGPRPIGGPALNARQRSCSERFSGPSAGCSRASALRAFCSRARLRRQRRHLAVGRIGHPRRPLPAVERRDVLAAIEPEVGDAARRIGRRAAVAPIAVVAADRLRLELRRLRVGKELAEAGRPLERRQRRVAPDALEVAARRCGATDRQQSATERAQNQQERCIGRLSVP